MNSDVPQVLIEKTQRVWSRRLGHVVDRAEAVRIIEEFVPLAELAADLREQHADASGGVDPGERQVAG